ncbi:hypothetical protein OAC92_00250 [Polaribacter sp.]|nr:hypothetical protein [Polaribacter sp.]
MNLKLINHIYSILFLYVFILPNTIYNIIEIKYSFTLLLTLITLLFIFIQKIGVHSASKAPVFFSASMIILGLLVWLYKQGVGQNAVLFVPFFSYFGYQFLRKFTIDLRWFNVVFICLFGYYYSIYFSKLPNLFFRPGFDEDAIVFERASSNGIAVALNITLYAYIILEYYFKQNRHRDILIISLFNVGLCFIQQSRSGIICSLLLLLIILFTSHRKWFKTVIWFLILFFLSSYILLKENNLLTLFFELGIDSSSYTEDSRSRSAISFFKLVLENDFFWGPPLGTKFASVGYTYNVFLDFWNSYSFLGFIILISIIVNRIYNWKKYYFPIYYFAPFFLYSMVESFFFPGYWDVIIYLLLFVKKPLNIQPTKLVRNV